ncbi:hypothetical protein RB200_39945 [Streptomyces sp. PmtG]
MTPTHAPAGQHRRTLATPPASAESVPHRSQYTPQPPYPHQSPYSPQAPYSPQSQPSPPPPQPAPPQDPPIYRALIRHWADRGRTLPGRHDPEWVRLAAPLAGAGQFTAAYGSPRHTPFGESFGPAYDTGRGSYGGARNAPYDPRRGGPYDGSPGSGYETGRDASYATGRAVNPYETGGGASDDTLPIGGQGGPYGTAQRSRAFPAAEAEADARAHDGQRGADPRLLISPAPQSSFGLRPGADSGSA